jgi:multidrug efflux pump subunit AcrA (membrane-fusion protein)
MASARQISANRQNAAKSTGPRSAAGKQRSRHNAVRHGLFSVATRVSALEEIEAMARALAGEGADELALVNARLAAEADIELNRARRARLALVERVESLGSLEVSWFFPTNPREVLRLIKRETWSGRGRPPKSPEPEPEDFLASMPVPATGPERTLEAMRRAVPELVKFPDYEKRAGARRDRAIRLLAGLK